MNTKQKTLLPICEHAKGNSNPHSLIADIQCIRLIFWVRSHRWTLPVLLLYIMILGYNVLTGWDGPARKSVPSSERSVEK